MTLAGTVARHAYSVEDAAAALSISRRSAYRLIAAGQLGTVKLRGRRLVPAAELERLISSSTPAPSGFANDEDSDGREDELAAARPPEKPQTPEEQPVRPNLSELLAKVLELSAGR